MKGAVVAAIVVSLLIIVVFVTLHKATPAPTTVGSTLTTAAPPAVTTTAPFTSAPPAVTTAAPFTPAPTPAPPVTTAAPPVTRDPSLTTLWVDANFGGTYKQLPIGNYPSLNPIGFPESHLSSLQVPANTTVILFTGVNFGGRSLYVYSDTPDLSQPALNFNNLTVSIKIVSGKVTDTPAPAPVVTSTAPPIISFASRPIRWVSNSGWSAYLTCGPQATCYRYGGVSFLTDKNSSPNQLWTFNNSTVTNSIGLPLGVRWQSACSVYPGDLPDPPGKGLFEWIWKPSPTGSGYLLFNPQTNLIADIFVGAGNNNLSTYMIDPKQPTGCWVVE